MFRNKTKSSLIIGILCAVSAAASVLLYFLPCKSTHNSFELLMKPQWVNGTVSPITRLFNTYTDSFSSVFTTLMFMSIVLLAVWAVLSLIRIKFAGVIGVIACILNTVVGALWLYCAAAGEYGGYNAVPYIMPFVGAVGIVLSIVQIVNAKKQ